MTRPRPKRTAVLVMAILACAGVSLAGCGPSAPKPERSSKIADADAGAIWITRSGCGSCHQIPGIMHADGLVGPPLAHFSKRTIIAGYLPNTRQNLIRWIQHPQKIAPGNAMPEAGLTEQQANVIAAYLYGIK